MTLGELLASWGYTLKDRGSVATIVCNRCRDEFAFPTHRVEPQPDAQVSWTLGVHAGSHVARRS